MRCSRHLEGTVRKQYLVNKIRIRYTVPSQLDDFYTIQLCRMASLSIIPMVITICHIKQGLEEKLTLFFRRRGSDERLSI